MIAIRKRLSKEERKKQIQAVAKEKFLKQGFAKTTMEDVIESSGMSTGGVYHYYKNTFEILYDLMKEGIMYRKEKISSTLDHEEDRLHEISSIMVDRIIDENEFKSLYAMFLQIKTKDETMNQMYEELKVFNNTSMRFAFGEDPCAKMVQDDFLIVLVNSLLLGYEVLGEKEAFIRNKELIKKCIYGYLYEKMKGEES